MRNAPASWRTGRSTIETWIATLSPQGSIRPIMTLAVPGGIDLISHSWPTAKSGSSCADKDGPQNSTIATRRYSAATLSVSPVQLLITALFGIEIDDQRKIPICPAEPDKSFA